MTTTQTHYFYDTETAPQASYEKYGQTFIWLWGSIDPEDNFTTGSTAGSLLGQIVMQERNSIAWFHNLRFDFAFLEWFMLETGWTQIDSFPQKFDYQALSQLPDKTYSVLRDGMGNIYSVDLFNYERQVINIYDSAKLYPTTIDALGKAFGVPKLSSQYDYNVLREPNQEATALEIEYLKHDIQIMKLAVLEMAKKYGGVSRTVSGLSYKEMVGLYVHGDDYDLTRTLKDWKKNKEAFESDFPPTSVAEAKIIQPAYSGGHVMINPKYVGKKVQAGMTADINSLYPYVLQTAYLPIGNGIEFAGEYQDDDEHPLYIQYFKAGFKLKRGGVPTLPKKYSTMPTLNSDEDLQPWVDYIVLTNIDLKHFYKNYDVEWIEFYGGVKWRQVKAPFAGIVNVEGKNKVDASLSGDKVKRMLAKLAMNSSYGKMGQNVNNISKRGFLDDDVVRYEFVREEDSPKSYLPAAVFVTSNARDVLFNGIYAIGGMRNFLYCDTDSIHFLGHTKPKNLPMSQVELGKWKIESYFNQAKFLVDKTYVELQTKMDEYYVGADDIQPEHVNEYTLDSHGRAEVQWKHLTKEFREGVQKDLRKNPMQIKGAGLTSEAKSIIKSIDDFDYGTHKAKFNKRTGEVEHTYTGCVFSGQVKAKTVVGGVILLESKSIINKPSKTNKFKHSWENM